MSALAFSGALGVPNGFSADQPAAGPNLIQQENAREGATDWQLTRVRVDKTDGCRCLAIEGYCSKQSVAAGEKLQIMVSTEPAAKFQIEIFRTGYYGGRGARLMTTLGPFEGKPQPMPKPDERTMHECRWEPAAELTIPADWPSGVYLGRLTTLPPNRRPALLAKLRDLHRPRRAPGRHVLFQCSDNTWQAYNGWPYKSSVYTHPKGGQGPWADVSFDRPYGREAQYSGIVNDPLSVGSGEFLSFEFPLAYWLEQHGYDVSYCSNSDMIAPDRGLKCKAFLSVGHDEYWDIRQYHSVVKMRDAGVNLLFLSGNAVCWVSPFKPSSDGRPNRVIFRGGPYGGSYQWAEDRIAEARPVPRTRARRRLPDRRAQLAARSTAAATGSASSRSTGSSPARA